MIDLVTGGTAKQAEVCFVNWVMGEIANPTPGFWSNLVDYIATHLEVKKSVLLFQEFYAADQTTLTGLGVISDIDTEQQGFYFFRIVGDTLEPVMYNASEAGLLVNVTETGGVVEFTVGQTIYLKKNSMTVIGEVSLDLQHYWGSYLPMFSVKITATGETFTGMLDADYENRISGSYRFFMLPNKPEVMYEVKNKKNQSISMRIPLFPKHSQVFDVPPLGTFYVHKTPSSELFLRNAASQGVLEYTEPAV